MVGLPYAFEDAVRIKHDEYEREIAARRLILEAGDAPQGVRAGFAAKLARLALCLDADAARRWLSSSEHGAWVANQPANAVPRFSRPTT